MESFCLELLYWHVPVPAAASCNGRRLMMRGALSPCGMLGRRHQKKKIRILIPNFVFHKCFFPFISTFALPPFQKCHAGDQKCVSSYLRAHELDRCAKFSPAHPKYYKSGFWPTFWPTWMLCSVFCKPLCFLLRLGSVFELWMGKMTMLGKQ